MRHEVVVLGEALWDVYPEHAHQTLRTRRVDQRKLGGAPANVACTLARLGIDVGMIAAVGSDALSAGLRDELRSAGVDTTHVVEVEARNGLVFIELSEGEPSVVPFRAGTADTKLAAEHVPDFAAEWLHLGSASFAACPAATERALQRAQRVSIDLNIYPFWFRSGTSALDGVIARADLVKASESDLRALGCDRAEALHARRPHGITVVTRGAEGAIGWWRGLEMELPAKNAELVDRTGAGDAFMAGLLATFLRDEGDEPTLLMRALRLGSALAGRAITQIGATSALRDLSRERAALPRTR
jgi:fructokinase